MIRYALACAKGHSFESWFQSSSAYDKQAKQKLITCPVCGSAEVEKELMRQGAEPGDTVKIGNIEFYFEVDDEAPKRKNYRPRRR